MTDEQKAALDLAILNLKTHGDDQLLSAVQPLIEFYESRVLAERKQEPVAWLYTMHMEGDQTNAKVTLNEENPFGEPDRDYSAVYPVIKEPLFTHPTPDDAKDAARYRWLKMQSPPYPQRQLMLSTPWGQWDAAIDAAMQADKEAK